MDHTELASMGGKARAKSMSKQQRQESARKAVNARWAKRKKAVINGGRNAGKA